MIRIYSLFIALTLLTTLCAAGDPMETLGSNASIEEKAEACRLISISGDVRAIPLLEQLLTHEQLSHMARYALEPMPGTEADAALRRALDMTSGTLKAGVISSLGIRRDTEAAAAIVNDLADEDPFVAEAAARALGRIAAPEGITALEKALENSDLPYAMAQALVDGLLAAADHAIAHDDPQNAVRLHDLVRATGYLPVHLRAAALRGSILAREPADGLALLLDAVRGADTIFFSTALRVAQEMQDKAAVSAAVAILLPSLDDDKKIRLVQLLGELGQENAGPALLQEATTGPIPTRIAALGAATRLAYAPVVPLLAELVFAEEADLSKAAKDGLSHFPGPEGDAAVRDMLRNGDARLRLAAVELVGQGALPEPVAVLMQTARDDTDASVRVAALRNAREYVGTAQLSGLLGHFFTPHSIEERLAAEQALVLICMRQRDSEDGIPQTTMDALCDGLATDDTDTRLAIIRILTAAGNQKAFDAVLALAATGKGDIQDAAMRAVCEWPGPLALPTLMDWVKPPPAGPVKMLALRGSVRLLMAGQEPPDALCRSYSDLLAHAASPDEKKSILRGLAAVGNACSLNIVLDMAADESVKAEAVQAALTIVNQLDVSPENAEALERAAALLPELSA